MAIPFRGRQFEANREGSTPPRPADAWDRDLLDRIRLGDQAALQALLDEYWPPLVRYADRVLDGADAAEDVVQEAFVRLWERRADWKQHRSARILLFTMVRNLAFNHRKSVGNRSRLLLLRPSQAGPPPLTPAELAESGELDRALEAAVRALPPRRREVLLLARHDGLSRAEIAALLQLSPQTVANHLGLAVAELRRALAPYLPSSD